MDSTLGTAISGLFGMVIALAIVLGLAYGAIRLMRHWQDRGMGRRLGEPDRELRFVRALAIGQRERLILVEAEGELMLIGVATGGVSLLRNWGKSRGQGGVGMPDAASADLPVEAASAAEARS